jgi:phospholipid-binding lipoprotein MlaA
MVANPVGLLIGTQVAALTTQVAISAGTTSLDAVDRLGQLKTAEDASIDFYSFMRSSSYQMRRAELRQAVGLPSAVVSPATSDLDDTLGDAGAPTAVAR